ncbi:MAG: response regulator [Deltaproteobacteria bacterium]|nr:response regulator [Deltaproteobacteria bacterium]
MSEKILIVEEDGAARKDLTAMLEKEGYDVKSMANGQVALDCIESDYIDVVLIAVSLPDRSGIKVLQKAGKISPDTKFIFLAEHGTMEHVIEAIRYQVHDYILKPFDTQEILSSVAGALALRNKEKRKRILIEQFENTLQQLKDLEGITGAPKAVTTH